MNVIKNLILLAILANTTSVLAKGGDDVGNGGFAYKQSVNILKMATATLEEKIKISTLKDIVEFPERRLILQDTLGYDDLDKLSKKNQSRRGKKLAMNYRVSPPTVIVLKPYFEAFAGKTDTELEDASLEVQKRLLHEASHIWGYNENEADKFSIAFLGNGHKRPTDQITVNNMCVCLNGRSDMGKKLECENICWNKPYSNSPILYIDFILGDEILNHPNLGNLFNWCNKMLDGDVTPPMCFLSAESGIDRIDNIPVIVNPIENSLTANLNALTYDRFYAMKLYEGKTGSNAQSHVFGFTRELDNTGKIDVGGNCNSDYECNSLCCNSSTGSCTPHDPTAKDPLFCSKGYGQSCISKEFCKMESIVTCKVVKSGMKADGTQACSLRCPTVPTFGDCIENTCIPPKQPPIPPFDPNDCSKAEDP